MGYSRMEHETSVVWDEEEKVARIYTASPVSMRKLDGLCARFPEVYGKVWEEKDADGRVTAAKYEVYKGYIRFGKPREVSDAQREAARERFAKYRAEKQ